MIIQSSTISAPRSALLIDVDNFHDPDQLRAVHSQFGQIAGKGFTCHAHGNVKLLYQDALKSVWQELAARLLPCLPLNKNTTDAALIIDALLLHFQHGVKRFGIVSGDADFAPLSLQLRELGCEVSCYSKKSIAFESIVSYYDRVVRFDVPPERTQPVTTPVALVASPEIREQASEVRVPDAATSDRVNLPADSAKAQEQKVVATSAPKPSKAISSNDLPGDREAVRKILAALPHWRPHTIKQLNQLGAPLRDAGVKKGNAPLHQFFRKYPAFFTVLPLSGTPKQIRLEKTP